jgi:glutamate carboxypeptidase
MGNRTDPREILRQVEDREGVALELLEELVNTDSGSYDADGVNAVADRCEVLLRDRGWRVERLGFPAANGQLTGDALVARLRGQLDPRDGGRSVLLSAHMDTVFPRGAAAQRPFELRSDGRAYGPGVCDDKAGIVAGITAADAVVAAGDGRFSEIILLLTPDEEIGSPASMDLVRATAEEADFALCLECARENGDLVSARKGVADIRIEITGRAAHAGVEPERGIDASLEAAHKVISLHDLNERWPGVTVNVGVIRAGLRRNVVCPHAELEVDLRAWTVDDFDNAAEAIRAIAETSTITGARGRARILTRYPPWERTRATEALAAAAAEVAEQLGFSVAAAATGGSADANTIASTGTPTLDGLGPIGGDDHSPSEWMDVTTFVPRVALLGALIARVGTTSPVELVSEVPTQHLAGGGAG